MVDVGDTACVRVDRLPLPRPAPSGTGFPCLLRAPHRHLREPHKEGRELRDELDQQHRQLRETVSATAAAALRDEAPSGPHAPCAEDSRAVSFRRSVSSSSYSGAPRLRAVSTRVVSVAT